VLTGAKLGTDEAKSASEGRKLNTVGGEFDPAELVDFHAAEAEGDTAISSNRSRGVLIGLKPGANRCS
jgi:hypothetical protein